MPRSYQPDCAGSAPRNEPHDAPSAERVASLAEELGVYQIELEMQNRELREAQTLLEDSRSRYADLYDFAPVGYCTLDALGAILEVNLTGAAMLGVERAQLLGQPLTRFLAEDDARKLRAHLARCEAGAPRVVSEVHLGLGAAPRTVVQLTSAPHATAAGQRVFRTVLADVTALQRTRASLRWLCDAGARLGALLDETEVLRTIESILVPALADRCAIYLQQGQGGASRVDPGGPPVAVMARLSARAVDAFPRLREALDAALATGVGELVLEPDVAHRPRATSPVLPRRAALAVALVVRGEVLGAVVLVSAPPRAAYTEDDLQVLQEFGARAALALSHARLYREAREAAEVARRERARAEEASRGKDDFLAAVSHELRTPLTSILGWTRMLAAGEVPAAEQPKVLATVERNARAQVQLIGDLLDVARIEAGRVRLSFEPVCVADELEAALEAARPFAETRGVLLELGDAPADLLVHGDGERVYQVITNLVQNALKFTPAGGVVSAWLRGDARAVELCVSDTGVGIAPDVLPHVFERFWQQETGPSRTHGGLGLGLAIVRQLVELHGGTVVAESEGRGRGATFRVRLPRSEAPLKARAPSATPSPRAAREYSLAGAHALLVEDEDDARALLGAVLACAGARVSTVESMQEALERLAAATPPIDVLVSDIGLAGEDGCALVRRVRALPEAQGGRTPALAVTAHVREEDRARVLDAGFDGYLRKPVLPEELLAAVGELLAARPARA